MTKQVVLGARGAFSVFSYDLLQLLRFLPKACYSPDSCCWPRAIHPAKSHWHSSLHTVPMTQNKTRNISHLVRASHIQPLAKYLLNLPGTAQIVPKPRHIMHLQLPYCFCTTVIKLALYSRNTMNIAHTTPESPTCLAFPGAALQPFNSFGVELSGSQLAGVRSGETR